MLWLYTKGNDNKETYSFLHILLNLKAEKKSLNITGIVFCWNDISNKYVLQFIIFIYRHIQRHPLQIPLQWLAIASVYKIGR